MPRRGSTELRQHLARVALEIDRALEDPASWPDRERVYESWRGMTSMTLPDFIESVALGAGLEDREQAHRMIRAVLHAVRARLTLMEGAHLATLVPPALQDHVLRSPRRARKKLTREEFVDGIRHTLDVDVLTAVRGIRTVCMVLERTIGPGELAHVLAMQPPEIRALLHPEAPPLHPAL